MTDRADYANRLRAASSNGRAGVHPDLLLNSADAFEAMLASLHAVLDWYGGPPAGEDWSPCMLAARAAVSLATEPAP